MLRFILSGRLRGGWLSCVEKKKEEQIAGASAGIEEGVRAKTLPKVDDLIEWKRKD